MERGCVCSLLSDCLNFKVKRLCSSLLPRRVCPSPSVVQRRNRAVTTTSFVHDPLCDPCATGRHTHTHTHTPGLLTVASSRLDPPHVGDSLQRFHYCRPSRSRLRFRYAVQPESLTSLMRPDVSECGTECDVAIYGLLSCADNGYVRHMCATSLYAYRSLLREPYFASRLYVCVVDTTPNIYETMLIFS